MLPLKIMIDEQIAGWVFEKNGYLKFESIHPHVRAALFAAKDNMERNFIDSEPSWEELSEIEESELMTLDGIEHISFLARQTV